MLLLCACVQALAAVEPLPALPAPGEVSDCLCFIAYTCMFVVALLSCSCACFLMSSALYG
jgi:hypothetical protein